MEPASTDWFPREAPSRSPFAPRARGIRFPRNLLAGAWLLSFTAGAGVPAAAACPADGRLQAELYGALETRLDWRAAELECEGMPRPGGAGARLRFAGPVRVGGADGTLALIIALPELAEGRTAKELRTTVTLIAEDNGRFFSNREQDVCWADVERQTPLDGAARPRRYAIGGIVYCVAPLAELNGGGSVMLRALEFSGSVDWRRPP